MLEKKDQIGETTMTQEETYLVILTIFVIINANSQGRRSNPVHPTQRISKTNQIPLKREVPNHEVLKPQNLKPQDSKEQIILISLF